MLEFSDFNGGPSQSLIEKIFLTLEVSEIIKFSHPKPWDDLSFLTHLYVKKRYSLRRISRELGCGKSVVRRKLSEAGIEIIDQKIEIDSALARKVKDLRESGLSYQKIAEMFNLWRVETRSGEGIWHAKTVRDLKTLS